MKILAAAIAAAIFGSVGGSAFANPNGKNRSKKSIAVAASHPKTVRVSVTKDGFSPSSIRAEKGSPLTLIFNRADNQGCGTEVVFESLNIRRKLPLKKNVKIVITPDKTGEIAFACGMGMMKGAIIAH